MRKTKIVCTIGPASDSVDMLVKLIQTGMNVARLNFSHGNRDEHLTRIHNIRQASEKAGKKIAILLDTKGPEIRTGDLVTDEVELQKGNELIISMKEITGTAERISVTYSGLASDVEVGSKILLDDGLIELEVIGKTEQEIRTNILNSGILGSKKGVNVPNVRVNLPGITEKDAKDIEFGIEQGVDFIAASFVRRASDVLEIREILEKRGATDIHIIPKIENQEGVDNVKGILEVSDGLMVARGDLGVEIPAEEVPLVQKMLIHECNMVGKPVITATQMLDSMTRNPRPTRAESSDVANAIFDGTDAIMLSGETAAGNYPVEAVETMHKIASRVEKSLDYREILRSRSRESFTSTTNAISQSVTYASLQLDAAAILTATESGHTARMISKYRPKASIIAVTSCEKVCKKLSLVWGVAPKFGKSAETTDEMLQITVDEALKTNLVKRGDLVIITAGVPVGEIGTTNLLKIHVIGDVVLKGQGIGQKTVSGKVVIAKTAEEANEKIEDGSILVTYGTDKEMIEAFKKASAVITEEGGLTSHAAIVGLSLGIPVVVGVDNATDILKDGQEITVDSFKGDIYDGYTSVI